jgi:hypothetical protein
VLEWFNEQNNGNLLVERRVCRAGQQAIEQAFCPHTMISELTLSRRKCVCIIGRDKTIPLRPSTTTSPACTVVI